MYSLSQVRTVKEEPRALLREVDRLYHTRLRTQHNRCGLDILDADWDNLVILDACRYDAFEECFDVDNLPGELSRVESKASATNEFLESNFDGREAHDTVYVTGTTMLYREHVLDGNVDLDFHSIVDAWSDSGGGLEKTSIEPEEIVEPETMVEYALGAQEEFPDKRLIIHFIQPHVPFLGDYGDREFGHIEGSIWRKQRRNEVDLDMDSVWRAYMENLELTREPVARLLSELVGKTVVTSDHGQLFGERISPIPIREYGHPNGIYVPELVDVPWFETDPDERKTVVPEPSTTEYGERQDESYDSHARDVLSDLGYVG